MIYRPDIRLVATKAPRWVLVFESVRKRKPTWLRRIVEILKET